MNYIKASFVTTLLISSVIISGCSEQQQVKPDVNFDISRVAFDDQTYPAVILGGGIAGLTAAVYFSQANIPCAVIEGPKPGGALGQSHSVRNWPGVMQAPGSDIVSDIKAQATKNGVVIFQEKVMSVNFNVWPREITVQDLTDSTQQRVIKALTVFIGMGTEPNLLGIPGESGDNGYWGNGVSNCAVCEGSLYKNRNVVIVGGGDAAITEADYLADIAKQVTVLVRKNYFRARDLKAKNKVLAKPNVMVFYDTEVREIHGNNQHVTDIVLYNNQKNEESTLDVDGFFLAIGSRPNTHLFKNQLDIDDRGFILLKNYQETSCKGIYAGGDVCDAEFVQAVTASGDGCKAALQATKFLKEINFDTAGYKQEKQEIKQEIKEEVKQENKINNKIQAGRVLEISSEQDFTELVLNSSKPVVLDLFANWCIPCQQMLPVIDKLAQDFKGDIMFVKLNVSSKSVNAEKLLGHLGRQPVRSVPTFMFVTGGKEIGRLVGTQKFDTFKQTIKTTFKRK